jgi:AmmeMemoRadiSam system protein B
MIQFLRKQTAAGEFYPDDQDVLSSIVEKALSDKYAYQTDNPFAIIAPMDSYKYAFDAYSASYSVLKEQEIDTVIILAPVQRFAFPGLALTDYHAFSTGLGDVGIDQESNQLLMQFHSDGFMVNNSYYDQDNAIEMQLPFLYKIFQKKIKILPIILGKTNTKYTTILKNAFVHLIKSSSKKFVIAALTNLSTNLKYEEAVAYDQRFKDLLLAGNPDHFSEQLAMDQIKAEGGGGVIVIQKVAEELGINNIRVIKQYNSGDLTGEKLKVTGYMSSVFF